ncbi:LysR family transcriptional regulator [Vibrio sp. Y2-5]|uniref:LysR family transcriptional regulator n=1 Tax=Vibrio sp. Y2-5 TaxID=2743977 RepID=UPI001660B0A7|nr:LysR family transcriptional regulator [Vibrio sp. Y2-5]MBD0785734.1 LysR family transcriptional regulator [Vibrio sp. Y2-5]
MDLNLVRTFLVVADNLSYTKAAEQMNITQPAVSSAIKRLEKEYGQALFVKSGRGIELTAKGYQLMPLFRQALDIIENAIHMREHFNVCCNEAILHSLWPMENITFTESPQDKGALFELMRQQKADLIVDTILTKDSSFVIEEVHREPLVVVCRKGHPRINGAITKQQYYQELHVLNSAMWENLRGFEQITQEPIEERKADIISGSIAGVVLHASQSDALAFVNKSFAQKWAEKLDLQVLQCPIKTDLAPYHLVYHKRELNNPAHKALRENIKQKLANVKL